MEIEMHLFSNFFSETEKRKTGLTVAELLLLLVEYGSNHNVTIYLRYLFFIKCTV